MSKINVLVVPSDRTGVGKFRSVDPHVCLQKEHGDEFHVDIDYNPNLQSKEYFQKYQIVAFHRTIGPDMDQSINLIKSLNKIGVKTVLDIDDYWLPTKEHPIHDLIRVNKIHEKIISNIKVAEYVTTTTSIFADEIRRINKNVFVIPNGIDPSEPQFKEPTLDSNRIRIGWLGGSSHLHDLELLRGISTKQDNMQFVLCGFDTRGSVTEINQETGEKKNRAILPHETVWVQYEKIFTDDYRIISEDYKNFLMKFKDEQYPNIYDQEYVRVWTKPVTSYAKNYSKFDISLAPLKNHIFNRVKSQLKVIEAGFYKKAVIASNVGPYTLDLKHSLENGKFVDGNALLVNENRNHSDWNKYIKKLVDNPSMIIDLGEKLYETVKDKYHLKTVTKSRAEFYKSILK
jgi:glycosyltransferase involved in cell wall biosynthesis